MNRKHISEITLNEGFKAILNDDKVTLILTGSDDNILSQMEITYEELHLLCKKTRTRCKNAFKAKREVIF
jgi:hypothetical protein